MIKLNLFFYLLTRSKVALALSFKVKKLKEAILFRKMSEKEAEKEVEKDEIPRRISDDQTELYGPNFAHLIDPEPSILSLFKFQMSRVQERSDNLVQLLKEASKLVRAEQVAAEALGALGTHYSTTSSRLASLTEIASTRTMASMQLEDGLVQAKSRLETFKVWFIVDRSLFLDETLVQLV